MLVANCNQSRRVGRQRPAGTPWRSPPSKLDIPPQTCIFNLRHDAAARREGKYPTLMASCLWSQGAPARGMVPQPRERQCSHGTPVPITASAGG